MWFFLHSSSSPSNGLLCIYLHPWYPLILNSTEKQNSHPWCHLTSLNRHVNMCKLCILNLGAVVYLNLFYMCVIKLLSWDHQSLYCQWCIRCHFAKVCTLQVYLHMVYAYNIHLLAYNIHLYNWNFSCLSCYYKGNNLKSTRLVLLVKLW